MALFLAPGWPWGKPERARWRTGLGMALDNRQDDAGEWRRWVSPRRRRSAPRLRKRLTPARGRGGAGSPRTTNSRGGCWRRSGSRLSQRGWGEQSERTDPDDSLARHPRSISNRPPQFAASVMVAQGTPW